MINDLMNIVRQIENKTDDQESFLAFLQERADHQKEMRQKVSSAEYIDWLYNYVSSNRFADDESALYTYQGVDSENGQILSWFVGYRKELARSQGVPVVIEDNSPFGEEKVVVKIRDKFFQAFTMYGQGSWSGVGLLDKEPEEGYILL